MRNKCPDSKALVNAFLGEMTQKKKASLIKHAFQCPSCRLRFIALQKIQLELEPKINQIPSRKLTGEEAYTLRRLAEERLAEMGGRRETLKMPFHSRYRLVYIAAAVVLVAGISAAIFSGKYFLSQTRSRGSSQEAFRLLEPIGELRSPPIHFSWTAFPDADIYLIQIIDENLSTILSDHAFVPEYTLPKNLATKFQKGKAYLWSIEAMNDNGEKIALTQNYFMIK